MKVIMATNNVDKLKEIRRILKGTDVRVVSAREAGIDASIEETGTTFDENAVIKAEAIRDLTGEITIADDSGLAIDFLDGAPGVYSSRFMGEDTSYDIKNKAILEMLADVPDEKRGARFVCSMAIAYPDRETRLFRGVMEGRIAHEIAGAEGFGYDPIFFLPEKGCTSAQLTPDEKNAISHRGKALRQVVKALSGSFPEGFSENSKMY